MQPLTNKKTHTDFVSGILLVNKPIGLTSHDVVDRIRHITGQRQVGHAGTLDPLAGGLLVVCLGKATKVSQYLAGHEKTYRAVVRLGRTSSTYDREGLDDSATGGDVSDINRNQIEAVLEAFRGTIEQKVPQYSAVHVDGRRLHRAARRGEELTIPSRKVTILSLTVIDYHSPDLTLDVTCSKGTYIRSLAHDIGGALGCGAYLHELLRTACGDMNLQDALTLEEVESRWQAQKLCDDLHPIGEALQLPALIVEEEGQQVVANGGDFKGSCIVEIRGSFTKGDTTVIENRKRAVLAIGSALIDSDDLILSTDQRVLKYARVLI